MVKKFWLALSVAYFALLLQFYTIFVGSNRFHMGGWKLVYLWPILTAIVALGAVYFVGYVLVSRFYARHRWSRRPLLSLMLVVMWCILIRSMLTLVVQVPGFPGCASEILASKPLQLALYALTIPLSLLFTARAKSLLIALYYVLSPALPMLVLSGVMYAEWDTGEDPQARFRAAIHAAQDNVLPAGTGDVFVLIFDEWSYGRTLTPEGELRMDLPNLRKLMSVSTLYTRAHTLGNCTLRSIPRFLFQKNEKVMTLSAEALETAAYSGRHAWTNSIFMGAKAGAQRIAVGSYHDYEGMLAAETDFAISLKAPPLNTHFGWCVLSMLNSQCEWLRLVGVDISTPIKMRCRALRMRLSERQVRDVHNLFLYTCRRSVGPVFALFHYMIPHFPNIWSSRGCMEEPAWYSYDKTSVRGYQGNLEGLDLFIGEIVGALEQAGRFEDALLILTSDHSWRDDPAVVVDLSDTSPYARTAVRHVPLIVKAPSQKTAAVRTDAFSMGELYGILEL